MPWCKASEIDLTVSRYVVENDRLIGRSFSFVALMFRFVGRLLAHELLVWLFNPNSDATILFTIAGLSMPNAGPNFPIVGAGHGASNAEQFRGYLS
jgi:hypothetical protein